MYLVIHAMFWFKQVYRFEKKKLYVHIPTRSYVKSRSSFSNGIGIKITII